MTPSLLRVTILTILCHCCSSEQNLPSKLTRGDNGGLPCASCTILLSIGSQLAEIHNETVAEALQRLCTYLPSNLSPQCQLLVEDLAPYIDVAIDDHLTVDVLCYSIGLCHVDAGRKMCHLFPLPPGFSYVHNSKRKLDSRRIIKVLPWICYLPGVYKLCEALSNTYTKLLPAVDFDEDKFSPLETLRGSLWRGRDCSDFDPAYRPGRRPQNQDIFGDSNCNGIYGVNATSQLPWESELCQGSGAKGIIYIGDSVGAHFHAPVAWFTPALLSTDVLANLSYVISNEFDWPDLGFATGFQNVSMPYIIDDFKVDSLYLRLRERNLCNHRDYQNLARNGATSGDTLDYIKSLSRHSREDRPALVIYSMVGNDVCNEKDDTVAHMTSVTEFHDNVVATLEFLEEQLPPGSHVILVGLIDGAILYKAMAKRLHPLGLLRKDLTYANVYDWFNCMEIGPCHGWMTQNATLRAITTAHAQRLSQVLAKIAQGKKKFTRFDVHYMPNPFQEVIDNWVSKGGKSWELIEPVDSLHPTQGNLFSQTTDDF